MKRNNTTISILSSLALAISAPTSHSKDTENPQDFFRIKVLTQEIVSPEVEIEITNISEFHFFVCSDYLQSIGFSFSNPEVGQISESAGEAHKLINFILLAPKSPDHRSHAFVFESSTRFTCKLAGDFEELAEFKNAKGYFELKVIAYRQDDGMFFVKRFHIPVDSLKITKPKKPVDGDQHNPHETSKNEPARQPMALAVPTGWSLVDESLVIRHGIPTLVASEFQRTSPKPPSDQ
jgi:hypothetical protein